MSIGAKDIVPFPRRRADRLDLTNEAHRLLLDDVRRGLAGIAAGRTEDADTAIARLQQRVMRTPQR